MKNYNKKVVFDTKIKKRKIPRQKIDTTYPKVNNR